MKRAVLVVMSIVIVGVAAYLFLPAFNQEDGHKEVSLEPFKEEGCLGLNYHRVRKSHWYTKAVGFLLESDELNTYNVYRSEFRSQIEKLKDNDATFVSEEELIEARKTNDFPDKCVWISFDDIDQTVYDNAFPILEEYDIPVSMFVIAGQVEKVFSNIEMVTWSQLEEMVNSGLVTIGTHSYDMHYLNEANEPVFASDRQVDAFSEDLQQSIDVLEEKLNVSITSFAYPFGVAYSHLEPILEASGIDHAFILHAESITKEPNMAINRIMVTDKIFEKQVLPWIQNKSD